jgi:hypothetical protein
VARAAGSNVNANTLGSITDTTTVPAGQSVSDFIGRQAVLLQANVGSVRCYEVDLLPARVPLDAVSRPSGPAASKAP